MTFPSCGVCIKPLLSHPRLQRPHVKPFHGRLSIAHRPRYVARTSECLRTPAYLFLKQFSGHRTFILLHSSRPPIKGGIRSWNHRSRARMWSLSCGQTSADASQDSTANVMAGWGLAKVNRADWRLTGSAAARLAQNLQCRQAATRKACQSIFRRIQKADMPAGSLYSPELISVIGWTTRRPFSKHQRKRSELRVGTMMPGRAKASAKSLHDRDWLAGIKA